ncbi:beta-ketoacyl-ACP synthase [Amorphus orientalis]|uniref:3-oxoacyl-[acyl-carrier-protein] synthase II n=1 Tax=Amorphus orientalis TaxID=649198 RepID=A0AAE3VQX4_9HYPH|nr:beta-ketoacyl-ACP synthase [Amorphus orientalis]MDQ0316507.1 3-oxoacyl-[acyl-carrier-protein] synthase II [Amorphus orientalis]
MSSATHDEKGRPLVAVTGLGVVTSLGQGKDDNWAALTSGRSGLKTITRFPVENLRTTVAGAIDFLKIDDMCAPALTEKLAVLAGEEALAQAGLPTSGAFPGPLFIAVPPVELEWKQRLALFEAGQSGEGWRRMLDGARHGDWSGMHRQFSFAGIEERVADHFGTTGAPISLTTACASGATSIQLGVEAIRRGDCDAVLCLAADGSVHPETVVRFSLLSALTAQNDPPEKASKPFSKNRDGFVVAEGGGAFVLESVERARARGAEVLAVVKGCGEQADDFHRTRSKPDGSSIIGVFREALKDADLTIHDIDYVNAHGTATPENDKMEYLALAAVFEDALPSIPVSSNKSMIGHTITAAGAVEAVFSVLSLRTGRLPPTINYDEPDPTIPLDVVPNVARDVPIRTVMSNSFGFGGQNVALILAAEPS